MSQVVTLTNPAHRLGLADRLLGWATIAAIITYLVWRTVYSLPMSYGALALALGILLLACEFISGLDAIFNYANKITVLPLEKPDIPDSWYPDVDIFVATHDEDTNLIYNTLNACKYVDYPDKSKVHIHLCDDGNREEMRILAEKLGVNYIPFPNPEHAKAGNTNNALRQTYSPLCAFLDADMIPRREFLTGIVPYFFLPRLKKNEAGEWVERTPEEIDPDYTIGFVQTPQNFYNPDLFQYCLYAEDRIPNEQIYFFREINVSRNRTNASLMCGSNMLISRKALEDVNYFAVGNITEDHETGIRIQTAGYTTYALPTCLANGLNPPALVNLIIQRERWGRGCMQTFHRMNILTNPKIPLLRRINYLCAPLYWTTFFCRFVFIMTPILVALLGVHIVECSLGELMLFWLPYYLLHTLAMSRLSSKTRTVHWNNTVDTIMFPFLVVPILLDTVGVRLKRFKVTDKSFQSKTNSNPMLTLPHIILFGMTVAAVIACLVSIVHYRAFYNVIILFWLVVNGKSLLLAIFFVLGRTNFRHHYRFFTTIPAELDLDGYTYSGVTTDISEGGLSIALEYPAYLPSDGADDSEVEVRLYDRDYHARLQCRMVQVKKAGNNDWVYSFEITGLEEHDKSLYRQIIYEREPTLPEMVNETIPVIEDIKVNFDRRLDKSPRMISRKLPRVLARIPGKLPDGTEVWVDDFSYLYARVRPLPKLYPGETASVALAKDVRLVLAAPEDGLAAQGRDLFKVVNVQAWRDNPRYKAFLAEWSGGTMPLLVIADQKDLLGDSPGDFKGGVQTRGSTRFRRVPAANAPAGKPASAAKPASA